MAAQDVPSSINLSYDKDGRAMINGVTLPEDAFTDIIDASKAEGGCGCLSCKGDCITHK